MLINLYFITLLKGWPVGNEVLVKVSPIYYFLNKNEQEALLSLLGRREAKKLTINEKTVEVTRKPAKIDEGAVIIPDISYDVPEDVMSRIPKNVPKFYDFDRMRLKVLITLQSERQIALKGEKGVGKNHLCLAVAQEFSLPVYDISGSRNLTEYDLLGRYEMRGGRTIWIDGILPLWCRYGGLLVLDELSIARSSVLIRINSAFDFRRYLVIQEHENERIDRHPYAFAMMTFNPPRGEYLGTQRFNIAFLDRFPVMEMHEPQLEVKREIIKSRTGIDDEIFMESLLEVAEKVNDEFRTGQLRDMISIRDLIRCCSLIENGLDKEGAIEISILDRFMDEERDHVKEICAVLIG